MNKDKRPPFEKISNKEQTIRSRKKVLRRLRKSPWDVWLLAKLSYLYWEEGKYQEALKAGKKAFKLAPYNPIIMWDYGRALYMNRRISESLEIYKKILRKKPKTISEIMKWSESKVRDFQNTCGFEIALCYIQLDRLGSAIRWLENNLANRSPGIRNYYPVQIVKKKLQRLTELKAKIDNKEPRLWISLLEVKVLKKNKRIKYKKGFTNGLAIAKSAKEAENCLRNALLDMGYILILAENTEEYEKRILKFIVDDKLKEIASSVRKNKTPKFGIFHMYPTTNRLSRVREN